MEPTRRVLQTMPSPPAQPGTTTIVRFAKAASPAAVLTQAQAQADRLTLALLGALTLISLALMPLYGTWLLGVVVGPLLFALGLWLHRRWPGSTLTRHVAGISLAILAPLLTYQSGNLEEPRLLWFLAATTLIAYQDWRCLWPAVVTFIGLLAIVKTLPLLPTTSVEHHPLQDVLRLTVVIAHCGICSVCAVVLRGRTLRAAQAAAELERARRELASELEQREGAQHALQAAKEHAEAALRVKGDFLAIMSHELRTPMNGILGMSHLLAETELIGEQREYVDAIVTSGDALLEIINDVLDYSKMEAGRLDIDPMPCDLRRVCEAVMDILAPKADEKGLAFVLRYRPDVPRRVVVDAARIRQVLLNLVGNAVKFTPVGRVSLDISLAGPDRLRLAISDTGIGLNPAQLTQLFQPFVQAEAGTTRTYGGTGLGLAISKRLVELMQGTIGVDSQPEHGSLFWFELPLARDGAMPTERVVAGLAGQSALVIDSDDQRRAALSELLTAAGMIVQMAAVPPETVAGLVAVLIDDHVPGAHAALARWTISDPAVQRILFTSLGSAVAGGQRREPGNGELHIRKPAHADALLEALLPGGTRRLQPRTPLPATRATMHPARGTILLVDDNYVSLRLTEQLLHNLGCQVVTAVDGVQTLTLAAETAFDAILLDNRLSDLAADQILAALRGGTGPNRRTPVIALSATADADEIERLRQAGMNEMLTKPVTAAHLQALVERFLKIR